MVLAKILILFSLFVLRQNKARNSVSLTFVKEKKPFLTIKISI